MYFALAGLIHKLRYLKVSLAAVLAIVGLKMLFAEPLKAAVGPAFNVYLLLVVLVVLVCGVLASMVHKESHPQQTSTERTHVPSTKVTAARWRPVPDRALASPRRALSPLAAAVGGMAAPALIYVGLVVVARVVRGGQSKEPGGNSRRSVSRTTVRVIR